jgi:predicted  nucleic acid-binding Zn-ribbon protein
LNPALDDLLALQDIDSGLDQARHRRAVLPERAQLAELQRRLVELDRRREATECAQAELARRREAAEADLAATEARRAAVERRLYSGEVAASRDLQALSAEADHLRRRVSDVEDAILGLMEEADPLGRQAEADGAQRQSLSEEIEQSAASLGAAESVLDGEIGALEERRRQAAAAVPAPLLATYERLRARLGGVAVARLVGGRCDGCHLTLSSAEAERARRQSEGEIFTCEQCSRILVP